MAYCYLLHFERPIAPGLHTCQHYLGYTRKRLRDRIAEHRAGKGARLTQVAHERGIGFVCVRTWPDGSRGLERRLKNQKRGNRLCPVCQGKPIRCRTR
jgi:predicted GIY-YIG superfamily endonuclease